MGSRTTPNFCSKCGTALAQGDAFCSQCGTPVAGESARTRASADSFDAGRAGGFDAGKAGDPGYFRRRVEDLTDEGWDVEKDYGDRVVMVDRGFGSIGVHVLLLLFTWGLGNLFYGWYHYYRVPDRIEIREGGTERYLRGKNSTSNATSESSPDVGNLLLSIFVALVGVGFVTSGGSVFAVGFGFVLLALAVGLFEPVRERLGDRKPITTFGPGHETTQEVVREPDVPCTACARPVNTGVKRTYRKRRYVAGVPVATSEEGENYYCRSCANGDPFTGDFDDEEREDREKTREFA
ncbi:zinc ribbon domain-containing protein [Halorussus halophilus]|uniref:zinc ribbon domain-containing protein n=1 Tax=Halorussus halophilus TaxID=2650975 RepID=UPI00130123E6|nr:zinc-ribbon domain-containing protein [Halorussus halophilus]